MEVVRCEECRELFTKTSKSAVKQMRKQHDDWTIFLCPVCRLKAIQRGISEEAK